VAAASALEIARSQTSLDRVSSASSCADLWRRSTSAGNLTPKPPRGMSAGSLSARSRTSFGSMHGGRSVLYKSMKYDSNDYSCVGSVGFYTLEAFWAMFSSAENSHKVSDGLLREGFLEMLAQIFTRRHGLLVQEEDRLLLKTLCRAIERASSAGDGVLPPSLYAQAHILKTSLSLVTLDGKYTGALTFQNVSHRHCIIWRSSALCSLFSGSPRLRCRILSGVGNT
jgi:hypothetical protein